jgi:broad specificity phosphatase PhoE
VSDTSGRSLLLVRHGRTVDNARGLLLGRADPELDELGRRQAEAVGVAIASGRFGPVAAVVSSPLRRRWGPPRPSAPVLLDDRLLELDYGELEGTRCSTCRPTWAAWQADVEFCPAGGESLAALGARCAARARTGRPRSTARGGGPGEPCVTRQGRRRVGAGCGDQIAWRTQLDNASITQVLMRGNRPALSLFNATEHLDGLVGAADAPLGIVVPAMIERPERMVRTQPHC